MIRLVTFLIALFASTQAFAQAGVQVYCPTGLLPPNQLAPCSSTYAFPITGSISASLAAFAPGGAYANLTSTASSADVALPAGTVAAAFNTGTTAVSCILSIGAGVATANKNIIQASSWFTFTVGSNTHASCINQAGDGASNVVVFSGGTGLPAGSGGGGGSSLNASVGSTGSAVPASATYVGITSGGNLTGWNGQVTANAGTNLNTSALATSANQATNGATTSHTCSTGGFSELGCLGQIDDDVRGPIPSGTNVIGGIFGSPNVTPTDCSLAITTGGTAQNIISAGATLHGFTIANIDNTHGSGEPVWFSLTTTAAAATSASYPLAAPVATTYANLSSYTTPLGFGTNAAVSVIAATTGHVISCTKW